MRRNIQLLLLAAVVVAVGAIWFVSRGGSDAKTATTSGGTGSGRTATSAAPTIRTPPLADGTVRRNRYRLTYEQYATVPSREVVSTLTQGTWTTTERADQRLEVVFAPTAIDGPSFTLPPADELTDPAQLVFTDGVLTAIAFTETMTPNARNLVTTLATTLQVSERAGSAYAVDEEDMMGRYSASYERVGDNLRRSRTGYAALRGADGVKDAEPGAASATEQTTFRVDEHGLDRASVEVKLSIALGPGMPSIDVEVRASLEREASELVPAPTSPTLPAGKIGSQVSFAAARENADRSFVGDATVADLIAEVRRTIAAKGSDGAGNARAQALAKLAALVRLDPATARELAAAIRDARGSVDEVRVLSGALASAKTDAATNTLAELVDDVKGDSRAAVLSALAIADTATPASLKALTAALDRPGSDQAAYGLGNHARLAAANDPEAAGGAVETLIARYRQAGSPAERRMYIEALGNSGDRRALPLLREVTGSSDVDLARAGAFSLRFIPGDDVDQLLEALLGRAEIALGAIRAVGYRAPVRWKMALAKATTTYADDVLIQSEIAAILRRWG